MKKGLKNWLTITAFAYIITMCSENPRQIVGFDAAFDKSVERIERIVWNAPHAREYRTDGYQGYVFVSYPGYHKRNSSNKDDTYTAESINSDLRHYIAMLHRRSKCFARKIENFRIVLEIFFESYNKFGRYKSKYQQKAKHKPTSKEKHLHKYKEMKTFVLNFL